MYRVQKSACEISLDRLLTGYSQAKTGQSFSRHEGVVYPVLVESQQECPPFY
jgi:hypothetical protein